MTRCSLVLREWCIWAVDISKPRVGRSSETLALFVHATSPRSVHQNGSQTNDDKDADNAAADNVKMVSDGGNTVPEAAFGLRHVLNKGENLNNANECSDNNGDSSKNYGIV